MNAAAHTGHRSRPQGKRTLARLLTAAWAAVLSATLLVFCESARADVFDDMRLRWHARLVGDPAGTSDPALARQIVRLTMSARADWSGLQRGQNRKALWSDLADWDSSETLTVTLRRLRTMALAYATSGSLLQGDIRLAADIVDGIAWIAQNHYRAGSRYVDNWWDWQIGAPQVLADLMVLMHAQLAPEQTAALLTAIDWFVPDPAVRLPPDLSTRKAEAETGANRLDKSLIVVLRGVLGKDGGKIRRGRDGISQTLVPVPSGDGFQADGTFVQHHTVPYAGTYGVVLLDDFGKLLLLLQGTQWAVTDPNLVRLYGWVDSAYRPFMFNGAMMDAVRGRLISRQRTSDHASGQRAVLAIAQLAVLAPPAYAAALKSLVKGAISRDAYYGATYMDGMAVPEQQLLRAIVQDSKVHAEPEPRHTAVFPSTDRMVMRGGGYALSVSMFSQRIGAFESGNGENVDGWWSGVGSIQYYDSDHGQYANDYWPTVDRHRLAGTTTDHSGAGMPVAWAPYLNTSTWAGGTQLDGHYAAAGMAFSMKKVTGSDLGGKKSWFVFGDQLVAIGVDIASTQGRDVETVVENRRLDGAGDNILLVDGQVRSQHGTQTLPGVRWAHLKGNGPDAGLGYYFPDGGPLQVLRERRSGTWRDINSTESAERKTGHYLSLALPHGVDPHRADYAYVLLPQRSAAATATYVAKPAVRVLARNAAVVAATDAGDGVVGANFWGNGAATVERDGKPYLDCDSQAAVLVREANGIIAFSVADPTQRNNGSINITLHRPAGKLLSSSEGVRVLSIKPSIRLAVDVRGAAGQSLTARFSTTRAASSVSRGVSARMSHVRRTD